jgi:hypothetical protein
VFINMVFDAEVLANFSPTAQSHNTLCDIIPKQNEIRKLNLK